MTSGDGTQPEIRPPSEVITLESQTRQRIAEERKCFLATKTRDQTTQRSAKEWGRNSAHRAGNSSELKRMRTKTRMSLYLFVVDVEVDVEKVPESKQRSQLQRFRPLRGHRIDGRRNSDAVRSMTGRRDDPFWINRGSPDLKSSLPRRLPPIHQPQFPETQSRHSQRITADHCLPTERASQFRDGGARLHARPAP